MLYDPCDANYYNFEYTMQLFIPTVITRTKAQAEFRILSNNSNIKSISRKYKVHSNAINITASVLLHF